MPSAADISAGRAFVSLYVKTSEFAHGLVAAETRLKTFGKSMEALGHAFAAISPANLLHKLTDSLTNLGHALSKTISGVGDSLQSVGKKGALLGVGLGAGILGATAHFAHFGDTIWVTAQRTGASTQLISEMGYALRQTGGTAEDFETSFRAMQRTIGDAANGSKEAQAALGKLGTSVDFLIGLSPDKQFEAMADGVAGIEDPTLAVAAALDVMGRGGVALVPAMRNMREFREEAQLLGLSVTPEQAKLAELLVDKFQGLKEAAFAGVFAAVEALGPGLLDAIKAATDLATRFHAWIINNQETVRLIGKVTIGLVAASAAAFAIGAAFKGVGSVVGILTGAFSLLGHTVAAVLPFVTILSALISFIGVGPIVAFVASLGSAIAASGLLATAASAIGAVFSIILPEILAILGVIAAAIAGIATLIVGVTVAAGAAAVAFWKLADPIKALMPVAKTAFEAVKNIGSALFSGNFQGAANAAIDGMKQVFLRGTMAILKMVQNTMERLPGFINSALSGLSGATSSITGTIGRLFSEMWPAVQASFGAFVSFAGDVLDQLPEIAGYVVGRITRAFLEGVYKLHAWLAKAFVDIASSLLSAFADLGPKLIKAMLTGNVDKMIKEIGMAMAAAGGLASGIAGGAAPEFKISGDTKSAFQKVSDQLGGAAATGTPGAPAAAESAGGAGGGTGTFGAFKTPKIEATPLQNYLTRLGDLELAYTKGKVSAEQYAAGIDEIREETLGVTPGPIQQFADRMALLNAALKDDTISAEEWKKKIQDAQHELLGIESPPFEQYAKQIEILKASLSRGFIDQAVFDRQSKSLQQSLLGIDSTPLEKYAERLSTLHAAMDIADPAAFAEALKKAQQDIFGIDPTPLDAFRDRLSLLNDAFAAEVIGSERWREEVRKAKNELLGIEDTPLQQFTDKIKQLQEALGKDITPEEFAKGFAAAQKDFLGLDPDPIAEYTAKIQQLQTALSKGFITPAQFDAGKLAALPDAAKQAFDETRTPMEKFRKEMDELHKLEGVLDPETMARKTGLLEKQLLEESGVDVDALTGKKSSGFSSEGTFSAAAAAGMGIGGLNNKELDAQLKANELLEQIREGVKGRFKIS